MIYSWTYFEVVSAVVGTLTISAHLVVVLLGTIGVLWSPVAAEIADRRNAVPCESAKFSVSMLLPWLYYRKTVLGGKSMHPRTVRLGYILAYMLWLVGPGGTWAGTFVYAIGASIVFWMTSDWITTEHIIGQLLFIGFSALITYGCLLDRRVGLVPSFRPMRALHTSQPTNITALLAPFSLVTFWGFASPILYVVMVATLLLLFPDTALSW